MTDFDQFWEAYPNKRGKGYARKCYDKQKKILPEVSELIKAINNQIRERKHLQSKNEFVPPWKNPSTWLNQECWSDACILPYQRPAEIKKSYTINTVHRAYDVLCNFGDEKFEEFCRGANITGSDKEAILYRHYCNFDVKGLARGTG